MNYPPFEIIIERLRAGEGKLIGEQASQGNERARQVMGAYKLCYGHGEPAAKSILEAAYKEWSEQNDE